MHATRNLAVPTRCYSGDTRHRLAISLFQRSIAVLSLYLATNRLETFSWAIAGYVVDHSGVEPDIPPESTTIRCLLMLWVGDYSAQCEEVKTIFAGIRPCRRSKLEGICSHNVHCALGSGLFVFRNASRAEHSLLLCIESISHKISLGLSGLKQN